MKRSLKLSLPIFACTLLFLFCNHIEPKKTTTKSAEVAQKNPKFNEYWYQGEAEITSYKLYQNRYGEIHEGTAVNIFVTEDFLPEKQVKADYQNDKNIPILKLNSTKKFITGIYPYSLMTSTFSPININEKTIKITFSSQEWCGNTFVQLNNREQFEIDFHSYFESNADRELSIEKDILENELWNVIRINPNSIKKGRYKVIPSFEFLALNHQKIKAYDAEVNLIEKGTFINLSVFYPQLKRKITITFTKEFPYTIENWEETITKNGKTLTTKAEKIKTIKSAYWSKNGVSDTENRKKLGL
ncbi:septum formation inhibitor Maf [Polaribacter aestuariivivens]|uniref:Septum formation inhibitor Maf n=1 Tax=Polaribacter aestuariivivens TaxID=2304626 RepID=A0A5S3N170_9FLAO|nr:septum formation inhibitor Maf [Polaribacter aestuariivivens]TMM29061.1 septum formation inhibitor Maf [Polaribacter aestuariivivens]